MARATGAGPESNLQLVAVGSAFPENEYTQQELTAALDGYWKRKFFNPDRLALFHKNMAVKSRRFCVSLDQLAALNGFGGRNDLWLKHALDLGEQALRAALDKAGLAPDRIDHIFFTTVTGLATPSIDARLINRLGMRSDVRRTPLFGLGCLGGAAGISRAADYVHAYPDKIAVLLSVELCSLTIQKEDLSIANIVSTGLFGDGAAAAIVAGARALDRKSPAGVDASASDDARPRRPKIRSTHASFYKDSERIMGWDMVDEGFKIVLSPNVPRMVRENAARDFARLIDGAGVSRDLVRHYICHPGGPKVLEAMADTLDLPAGALDVSWKSLRDIGNLSSTSVLLILQEYLEQVRPPAGDYGVLMAMGPGFCSEWVLLEFHE